MLEIATTVAELEAQANEIISRRAMRIPSKEVAPVLDGAIKGLKGDSVVEKLTVHTVNFNEDGTTTVAPRTLANSTTDSLFLESILDEGKSIMVSNTKGDALCFSRINVCGTNYLMHFRPQDAQTIRNDLIADLKAPKEPSTYDKICDFFARHVLDRPGKAVAAYNEQKQFYDSMQKTINSVSNILEEVEGFKQSEAQKQFDEQQRQEELERQRQEQLEQERLAKEKEEADRKAQEELKKQEEQRLQKLKAEEDKKFEQELKAQKLEEALTKKQPKEVDIAQIGLINGLYENLPKQVWQRDRAREVVENQKNDLKKIEGQLDIVKADYDRKKMWVDNNEKALNDATNELKKANDDIKKLDQIKILSEKKAAANEKLNNANKDVKRYQKELNEEKLKFKKIEEEYEAMRGDEFLNNMTPEQYIHHLYIKAFENRKKMFEETERQPLLDEMKEVRDAIDVIKGGKEKVDEASNWKDRAWGIKYFRVRGKAMMKLDDQVAELEKEYAELQKQIEQKKIAFDEEEKKFQARDDAHTPENLKMAKDFLDANRAKGEAQRKAGRDSVARQNQLKGLINQGKLAAAAAQKDLDELGKDPLSAYQYNAEGHEYLKSRVPGISQHIEELKPQLKEMKIDLRNQEQLVTGAEIEIDKKKADIVTSEKRYEEAKVTVSKSVGTIVHNASLLQKRGVEVPQPPANVLPYLPLMPLFQPQQPQAQPAPVPGLK